MTIRLDYLRPLLERAAKRNGITLSEEVRNRLAGSLGVEPPDMRVGNPDMLARGKRASQLGKRAAKKRHGEST